MGCRFAKFARMYLSLFFGWRPSQANWVGAISTLLTQYIAAHATENAHTDGPGSFVAYQYVDDGAFVESWIGLRHWEAICLWRFALVKCLGNAAARAKKRTLEGNSGTTIVLRGITISTGNNTFSSPDAKIGRSGELLTPPVSDPCIARIPLRKLQELRGMLAHWSNCNVAIGAEMGFIDKLAVSRSGVVRPG